MVGSPYLETPLIRKGGAIGYGDSHSSIANRGERRVTNLTFWHYSRRRHAGTMKGRNVGWPEENLPTYVLICTSRWPIGSDLLDLDLATVTSTIIRAESSAGKENAGRIDAS